jgi:hypothetical protein
LRKFPPCQSVLTARQAIRKVTALLSVEEELADVNAAERVVAIKENERRAITAKLSSEADGTSPLFHE